MSSSVNPLVYLSLLAVPIAGMIYYLRLSPEGKATAGNFFRPTLSSDSETAALHREAIAVATGQRPGFKEYKKRLLAGDLSTPLIVETPQQRAAREAEEEADEARIQAEIEEDYRVNGPIRSSEGGKAKHKKSKRRGNKKTRKGRKRNTKKHY
jgi:hypothetical protein